MSNWQGTSRSNYFKVKDTAAFEMWLISRNLQILGLKAELRFVAIAPGNSVDG